MSLAKRTSSIRVPISRIISVTVITLPIAVITAEHLKIDLVQDDTQQIFVNPLRAGERVFGDVDFRSPPFDNEDERVDQVRHRPDVDYGSER